MDEEWELQSAVQMAQQMATWKVMLSVVTMAMLWVCLWHSWAQQ